MSLKCKGCGGANYRKNGFAHGHQRYFCRDCRLNFTDTPPRGQPEAAKSLAVLLYGLGGVTQGFIAKLLKVSHVSVYRWIRAAGLAVQRPDPKDHGDVLLLDEMWHFVDGKKILSGSGKPMTLLRGEWSPGRSLIVLIEV